MKNVKNIFAMLVLVTVMGVSSTFGGIYINDRSINNDSTPKSCDSVKVDTILDLTGIIVAGLTGIIVAGRGEQQPCTTNEGGTASLDGIIVAG